MISSKRDAILLAVVGTIAVLAGFWQFLLSPARGEKAVAIERVEQARVTLSEAKIDLARQKSAIADVGKATADVLSSAKAVPEEDQQAALVVLMNELAKEAGVAFQKITPSTAFPVEGVGATATPYELEFKGAYLDLNDLIYRLQRLVNRRASGIEIRGRLMAVQRVRMAPDQGGYPDLLATINLVTYTVAADPAAGAASGDTAASAAPATPPAAAPGASAAPAPASGSTP